MSNLKINPYNLLVHVPEHEEFVLYNTLTSGLQIINNQQGFFLSEIDNYSSFDRNDYNDNDRFIQGLLDNEYLINEDVDLIGGLKKNIDENQFKNAKTIHLTIGTTITCNMGCSYCFEFIKPNNTLKSKDVIDRLPLYIEEIISKSNSEIETISVTWYGGEPLINVKAIIEITPLLKNVSKKYNLKYNSNIITNGIYLNERNWKILEENEVNDVQITIDGPKKFHDIKRPLKQKNLPNYEKILDNLTLLPENSDINVTIRINVDRDIAGAFGELLDDFYRKKLWPMNHKSIHFDPAFLRMYDEIDMTLEEKNKYLSVDEFFEFKQNFRVSLVERYNLWAVEKGKNKAKLKWDLPSFQSTCATWASPISMTIDPNGFVHKCWETIHDDTKAPASIFNEYIENDFKEYSSFNRYNHNTVCTNCKFVPICDNISCSHEAIKSEVPQCTHWKYTLEDYLKVQYLKLKTTPELISLPTAELTNSSGHSEK